MALNTLFEAKRFLALSGAVAIFDLVRGILVVNILGPEATGLCLTLMVIPQIAQYLFVGPINAMAVLVPAHMGRGEIDAADAVEGTVLRGSLLLSVVSFACVALYAAIWQGLQTELGAHVVLAGLMIVFWSAQKFLTGAWAARNDFRMVSKLELSFSFLVTVGQVALCHFYGAFGYWWGSMAATACVCFYMGRDYLRHFRLRVPAMSAEQIRELGKLGLSMLISSVSYTPFIALSKVFLARSSGILDVGYFVLVVMAINRISIIARAISRVILPSISHMNVSGASAGDSMGLFIRAQAWTLGITIIVALVGWFLLPSVVAGLMPDFAAGVPAARVALLAGIPYNLIDIANNYILAKKLRRAYVANLAGGVVFQVISFVYLYATHNVSSYSIALSFVFVFCVYAFTSNLLVMWAHRGDSRV